MDDNDSEQKKEKYERGVYCRIVKCAGCDTLAFVKKEVERWPPDYEEITVSEMMFPEWKEDFIQESEWEASVPDRIKDIYSQTVKAFNYELNVLCAAGIRAIIEGCCLLEGIKEFNLEKKLILYLVKN